MLGILSAIAGPVISGLFGTVDQLVEDKDLSAKLKNELQTKVMSILDTEVKAARDIIIAEAQGGSWIQRSWRPITMLTFVGLIVAKWLGFTAPGISEAIEIALLDIIKIGLGGYVVGRSVEKGVKVWKQ
jgi:hypothetical protein